MVMVTNESFDQWRNILEKYFLFWTFTAYWEYKYFQVILEVVMAILALEGAEVVVTTGEFI
jgi:hypothetical protein